MPSHSSCNRPSRLLYWIEVLTAIIAVGWLLLAALSVKLEYYDGFDSILNARYFTGQISEFCATRGPLLGLLLTPAEWVRQAAGLHPLDVRPHHMVMAFIHGLYFFLSYRILTHCHGRSIPTLLAFFAAVPTFIVMSYLPFVSHDIYPGVILLGMVVMSQRFMDAPDVNRWVVLVALGAAAATTKHVLGLFWIAILVAVLPELRSGRMATHAAMLLAAAVVGAMMTWVMMSLSLSEVFPDSDWWLRARDQLVYLAGPAHDHSEIEPWWVYIRNLPAYGLTAMILVPLGLRFSMKGTDGQRLAARAWLVLVIAMHLIPLRQVRYLACLGPLTAYIIQPVLQRVGARRSGVLLITAMLICECLPMYPYSRLSEAARIASPFYRSDVLGRFLSPAEEGQGRLRLPVYLNWRMLSFAPDWETPLKGDLYHDLFHFGNHHLYYLYGLQPGDLITVTEAERTAMNPSNTIGSLIFSSPGILIHNTAWDGSVTVNK
jgi:hypothetical protein